MFFGQRLWRVGRRLLWRVKPRPLWRVKPRPLWRVKPRGDARVLAPQPLAGELRQVQGQNAAR